MAAKRVLITGGAGVIGSEVVRQCLAKGYKLIVVDKLTYAGSLTRLAQVRSKIKFYKTDICDKKEIEKIFKKEKFDWVMHLAAESHVDRSIADASPFIRTNFEGTQVMLDAAKRYGVKRFLHVSTDEVYGEIEKGKSLESSPFRPNSPYSVSKAAADMLAQAYWRTYSLPVMIVRPCNNYGRWQYPEKLIPVIISKALKNKKVPVYARGLNVREWLYVEDCARAVAFLLERGQPGEVYNIGSGQERRNIDVVKKILSILSKPESLIEFVQDRPGHDLRYCLDYSRLKKLGWQPRVGFEQGLRLTVEWYKNNFKWADDKINSDL
jgi:dTDP-glucose 4,6-dehydratase